jgi:tetratricopeptide (TPR) repeat protein
VAQLCRRLDGLPLAIELAAARVRFLPPDALLARLGGALPLLSGGARDAPPHHRSLRAALEWSYSLLAPEERVLFRRLAVFAGGCTPEAATAVCVGEDVRGSLRPAPHEVDAFETLAVLVEHSLVGPEPVATSPAEGPRLAMLETVRAYAREQLEAAGEAAALCDRHAAYFLALAERFQLEAQGPGQPVALDRLDAERGNLRAALRWYRERGEAQAGLRLAGALWRFWWIRGPGSEGREWLSALLELPGAALVRPVGEQETREETPATPDAGRALPAARAKALFAAGMLAQLGGDEPAARAAHAESLAVAEALGDAALVAYALHGLARCALHAGETDAALALAERSVAGFETTADAWGRAFSLELVGGALDAAGAPGRAAAVAEESLALWRRLGDPQRTAVALDRVALATLRRGDAAGARARYEESLAVKRALGDRPNVLWSLVYLADVARQERDWTAARTRYEEAASLARDLGEGRSEAFALNRLGWLALQRADFDGARDLIARSLAQASRLADARQIVWCLHTLAELEQVRGATASAARLAGAAQGLVERLGLAGPDGPAVPLLGPAAGSWDDRAAAAWAAGRALSLEQAVADAMGVTAARTPRPGTATDRRGA